MAENKPTDEELAYLRARRLIDAGLALASATFQVAFTYTYIYIYLYLYSTHSMGKLPDLRIAIKIS